MKLNKVRKVVFCSVVVGLFLLPVALVHADAIVTANANVSCTNYQLTVQGLGLPINWTYYFKATIIATPASGSPITIPLSYEFDAPSTGYFYAFMGSFSPALTGYYSFSGTASLTDANGNIYNTMPITFSPNTVSCPATSCPGSAYSSLINNLGTAGPSNFAVLSLGGANSEININMATISGNVGLPNYGVLLESKPSTVTGTLTVGSAVNTSQASGSHGAIIVNDSLLTQAVHDADTASGYFAALPVTPAVQSQFPSNGQITGNLTVTGGVGLNVVDLSSFTLNNGNATLTLTGPAGTAFVINVKGAFNLHTGNIAVGGGMGPLDVVYNITSPSATVTTMVPTKAVGILLAPNNAINTMDSSSFVGEVIGSFGQTMTFMSATNVTNPCGGGAIVD